MRCSKDSRCIRVYEEEHLGADSLDQAEELEYLYEMLGYETKISYDRGYVVVVAKAA